MTARTVRTRLRVEELILLFGEGATTRLIRHCGGKRVPSFDQYLRTLRRRAIVAAWLNRGYSKPDVARKYGVSLPYVKRVIARHLRDRYTLERRDGT